MGARKILVKLKGASPVRRFVQKPRMTIIVHESQSIHDT
jgi:hypothetical protein